MFKFPDNCITEASRGPFCLRYQERQHELCVAGLITEAERAANVRATLPFLSEARKQAQQGRYPTGKPPWVASKSDWNGTEVKAPPGLNVDHNGAAWSHAERVLALNSGSPDIEEIFNEVAKAKMNCLFDPFWDKDIDDMWLESHVEGEDNG